MTGLLLAVLAIATPLGTLQSAYARPEILSIDDIPSEAKIFRSTFGDAVELVAFDVEPAVVLPGQSFDLTLYWRALAPMADDYSVYIHLFGLNGVKIAQRDSHAGMGTYPTSQWSPGRIIRDRYEVQVDPRAQGPVAAELQVGIYRLEAMEPLPAYDGLGRLVGRPILTRIKVKGSQREAPPTHSLSVSFAQGVRLIGYDLPTRRVRSGQTIPLTLHWESSGPLDDDYTVLVHLVTPEGEQVGQGDGPPLDGAYPTSYWGDGERLVDRHELTVKTGVPEGRAHIYVGLYDLDSGQRLPIQSADVFYDHNQVLIETIEITGN